MNRVAKALGGLVCGLLVAVILGLVVTMLVPGFHLYYVLSDSMSPAIRAGDAIVTVPAGFLGREVEAGAIVSYTAGDKTVTHRVQGVDAAGGLVTKGDASEEQDANAVPLSAVTGVYLLGIPSLGYFSAFTQTRMGRFATLVLPVALLVLWLVLDEARKPTHKNGPAVAS